MNAMSCATRSSNASFAPTRRIPRRALAASSLLVLDRGMDRPSNYHVLNRQRRHAVDARRVRQFLSQLTLQLGRPAASLSVVFVTDEAMRMYNRNYRGLDKATDVLSFAGDDGYLGDILISAETAYNQARKSPTLTFETNVR